MKKSIALGLSAAFVASVLSLPKTVSANEGLVNLRNDGADGACFAASVYVDGVYRILATCRDLKIALSPEKNRYVLWVETEEGKNRRIGEITNGKLSVSVDDKFSKMFVSAETDAYTNKPSEDILLRGDLTPINFGKTTGMPIVTPTPTQTKEISKVSEQKAEVTPSQSGLGSALSTIFKIALFGFGVLLVVVGVFSFISRKRGL